MLRKSNNTNQLSNNDNALHQAVRNYDNLSAIKTFICQQGKAASKMARSVNDAGVLPLQLIKECRLSDNEKEELTELLIKLATSPQFKKCKKISDPINLQKMLGRYKVLPNTELYNNMLLAYELATRVRAELLDSRSHPQSNNYTDQEKINLNNGINEVRSKTSTTLTLYWPPNFLRFLSNPNSFIDIIAKIALKYKKGNCYEFAITAWYFLKQKNKDFPAQFWRIEKGDHNFLVIGQGPDKVVCDPWAGKVYPFTAINNEIRCHKAFKEKNGHYTNLTIFYNPCFHRVMRARKFDDSRTFHENSLNSTISASLLLVAIFILLYLSKQEILLPNFKP